MQVESAKDYPNEVLEKTLYDLEGISYRLRGYGRMAFVFTILNLGLFILSLSLIRFTSFSDLKLITILSLPVILGCIVIFYLIIYEGLRKQGDTLFEEISDELQWNVQKNLSAGDKPIADERPLLLARITLRTFARTTDLPLVPGRFGPAIYTVANILIIFLVYYSAGVFRNF